jgi:hypothetical protein
MQMPTIEQIDESLESRATARRILKAEVQRAVLLGMSGGIAASLLLAPPWWIPLLGAIIGVGVGLRNVHYARLCWILSISDSSQALKVRYLTSLGPDLLRSGSDRERRSRDEYDAIDQLGQPSESLAGIDIERSGFREYEQYLERILTLSSDQRLIADLGSVSRRGVPVLTPVGALDVVKLLAAGHPIYIISASYQQDSRRRIVLDLSNLNSTKCYRRELELTVRHFDYRLEVVTRPDEIDAIMPSGIGLPPGIPGVYVDRCSISEIVAELQCVQSIDIESFNPSPLVRARRSNCSSSWHTWYRGEREDTPRCDPLVPTAASHAPRVLGLMGAIVSAMACVLLEVPTTEALSIIAAVAIMGVVMGDTLFLWSRRRSLDELRKRCGST